MADERTGKEQEKSTDPKIEYALQHADPMVRRAIENTRQLYLSEVPTCINDEMIDRIAAAHKKVLNAPRDFCLYGDLRAMVLDINNVLFEHDKLRMMIKKLRKDKYELICELVKTTVRDAFTPPSWTSSKQSLRPHPAEVREVAGVLSAAKTVLDAEDRERERRERAAALKESIDSALDEFAKRRGINKPNSLLDDSSDAHRRLELDRHIDRCIALDKKPVTLDVGFGDSK